MKIFVSAATLHSAPLSRQESGHPSAGCECAKRRRRAKCLRAVWGHWGQMIFTEPGIGPGDTRMQHGDKLRRGICGVCLLNCGDIIIAALETVLPPGGVSV